MIFIHPSKTARTGSTVLAFLVCSFLGFFWGNPGPARAQWLEDPPLEFQDRTESGEITDGPAIAEPLFSFMVSLARGDSLGSWNNLQIQEIIQQQGRPSRFPLEELVSISRRRATEPEDLSWPFQDVRAVWEIHLKEDLDRSMPYSILGYHPGSLRVSRFLRLTETHRGVMALHIDSELHVARDVIMLRLDEGHVLLDVDGLVDRLLGKSLDDSGTVGFVLALEEEQPVALAVSFGRNGRRIYGEFDFRQDKVLPNGRPFAKALSAACRQRMLRGYVGPTLGAWVEQ